MKSLVFIIISLEFNISDARVTPSQTYFCQTNAMSLWTPFVRLKQGNKKVNWSSTQQSLLEVFGKHPFANSQLGQATHTFTVIDDHDAAL